jgi:2'-5' RNA ligase
MRGGLFYLMVKPPPVLTALITAMPGVRVCADRLHITLARFGRLGELPIGMLPWLVRILAEIDAQPFRVVFDQIVGGKDTVLLAGSGRMVGTIQAQRLIVRALALKGVPVLGPRPFSPHLTIDYEPNGLGCGSILPISWQVREFLLIESGGGSHRLHGRFPLRAEAMAA